MSEISEQIIDELLEERLLSHPVRVWYDPRQKYRGIIHEVSEALEAQDVNFGRYDGSYLELKAELWQRDPDIDEQSVDHIGFE